MVKEFKYDDYTHCPVAMGQPGFEEAWAQTCQRSADKKFAKMDKEAADRKRDGYLEQDMEPDKLMMNVLTMCKGTELEDVSLGLLIKLVAADKVRQGFDKDLADRFRAKTVTRALFKVVCEYGDDVNKLQDAYAARLVEDEPEDAKHIEFVKRTFTHTKDRELNGYQISFWVYNGVEVQIVPCKDCMLKLKASHASYKVMRITESMDVLSQLKSNAKNESIDSIRRRYAAHGNLNKSKLTTLEKLMNYEMDKSPLGDIAKEAGFSTSDLTAILSAASVSNNNNSTTKTATKTPSVIANARAGYDPFDMHARRR